MSVSDRSRALSFSWAFVLGLVVLLIPVAAHGQIVGFPESQARDDIIPGDFYTDPPTLENLGFRWYVDGDQNRNATVEVEYRESGDSTWLEGQSMLRIRHDLVQNLTYRTANMFAGSVMFLEPGTEYEVRFTMTDPDGGAAAPRIETVSTRSQVVAYASGNTISVQPGESIMAAYNAAVAGDIIMLEAGVHQATEAPYLLEKSGEPGRPIIFRGAGMDQSIIEGPNINTDFFCLNDVHDIVFEDLTLRTGSVAIHTNINHLDDMTNHFVYDHHGPGASDITVRRCKIEGVMNGIHTSSYNSKNWTISDNVITGLNEATGWYPWGSSVEEALSFIGINIYGQGHAVCYNKITWFMHLIGTSEWYDPDPTDLDRWPVNMDLYNNELLYAVGDVLRTDSSAHNIRVYRNLCLHALCGISVQPVYGGPIYLIRNEIWGITENYNKWNNDPAGIVCVHNTYGNEFYTSPHTNCHLRNNVFFGGVCSSTNVPEPHTMDYDAFEEGSYFHWANDGGDKTTYTSLAAFTAATGYEVNGLMISRNDFVNAPVYVVGTTLTPDDFDLRLVAGSGAIDSGLHMPNINDDYLGAAPDRGALEYGAPLPHYGPRGSTNAAPSVDAGVDDTITLPADATLGGTVTDDGLPNPPASVTATWTMTSGPGTVTFGNAALVNTTAAFSTDGTYVLRLTADDSELTAYDEVTITVYPPGVNTAPSVNAGSDDTITLPADATLDGTVTDDDLPNPPASVTTTWTMTSGPGTVTFGNAALVDTTAAFSTDGTYVLRLTADDSALQAYDEVAITVNASTIPYTLYVNDAAVGEPGTVCTVAGDDANDGFSPDTPMRNIQTLLDAYPDIGTGTTVWVDPGTYVENVTILATHSGLTLQGAGRDVTIIDGNQAGSCFDLGAFASVTISSFTIQNGSAGHGGGVYIVSCNPTITDCLFTGNAASLYGGAIYNGTSSSPTISNCTFDGNSAVVGGGIINHHSSATVTGCTFVDNTSDAAGAGGAVSNYYAPSVSLTNCIITGSTGGWGAGLYNEATSVCTVTNSTFSGNTATNYGGGLCNDNSTLTVTNCILWGNSASSGPELAFSSSNTSVETITTVSYSDVQGGQAGVHDNPAALDTLNWGTGNMNANPLFENTANDDYSLQAGSPCIDSADGPTAPTADMDGNPRVDVAGMPNVGIGPPWADMGAYECQSGGANSAPNVDAGADDTITLPADATLDGTVTDDGLPNPPASVTTTWTRTSGPGTVTFGNAGLVDTTASFSTDGTYVLRLTADDSALTAYDEVTITVNPAITNSAPNVNAGADDTITLPADATLDGTVADDGLPNPPASVTTTWTMTSGPGTVTFGNASLVDTTAAFSVDGTYVLRLTADDSELTAYDEVTITVNAAGGTEIHIEVEDYNTGGDGVGYHDVTPDNWGGEYRDDDVDIYVCTDTGGGYQVATIDTGEWLAFDVNIPSTGNYDFTFRVECASDYDHDLHVEMDGTDVTGTVDCHMASWGDVVVQDVSLTAGSQVMTVVFDTNWHNGQDLINYVKITSEGGASNTAPTVDAGSNDTITLPANATLDGTVTDDGLPNPPASVTTAWTMTSGPGTVTFGNAALVDTTASFSVDGTYVLRLTADDSELTAYDEVTITANPANTAPTVDAGTDDTITLPADATLDGTVTDDGLPNPPASVTTTWTMTSGPGTVTFGNAALVDTTAAFSTDGTYVLRLTADDSELTAYDEVTITVNPANTAPTVDAGADDTITLPADATLDGTVTDDGLPNPPASVTTTWTMTSGPGTVTFGNAALVDTTAAFSTDGTYVLRLTADDSELTAYDEVTITVNPANTAPSVDAGDDETITLPADATLDGTVTDDGWPNPPASVTTTWTMTSGPGTVTFGNAGLVDTTAAFSTNGTYVLRLTADDSELTAYDEVTITVNPANTAPTVDAGSDDTITLPSDATLDGTVTDDGLPNPPASVTTTWTMTSGPGTVTFGNAALVDTTAAFSTDGTYVLRLTADDSELTAYHEVTITVNAAGGTEIHIEVEDYNTGGEGVAYHDATPDNYGGEYRNDDVDIYICTDTGGGYQVACIDADEWLAFDVNIPATGNYDFTFRVECTSDYAHDLHVEMDGTNVTGTVDCHMASWGDVIVQDVSLTAGSQVMTVLFDTNWHNGGDKINYVKITSTGGASNAAPTVDAGSNDTVTLPAGATLDGTVTDDGWPNPPASVTTTWTRQIGPGTVVFGDANAVDTTAYFSTDGTYVLRLTADDSELTAYDEVTITVNSANMAPTVDAGADDTVALPADATLDGTVTDDGWPNPPASVTTTWTMTSGPGTVTFGDANAVDTTASFSLTGTYVLRLTADDSALTAYDEVTITVNAAGGTEIHIEVEDYNTGGEGLAYHDATPDNYGGEYRNDDVDIYICTDAGGGYQVACIDADEWLAFDVNIPATGNYDFTFRVQCTSDYDHDLHVEMDGTNVTGTVDCHMTSWGDVVVQDVSLTAGSQVMTVVFDTNWHNGQDLINYVKITSD